MGSTLCKARKTGLKLGREERLKRGGESYVGGVCARVDVMSCLATMRGIVERCVDVNVAAGAMCVVSRAWRRARCGRHRVRRHCGHVVVSIAQTCCHVLAVLGLEAGSAASSCSRSGLLYCRRWVWVVTTDARYPIASAFDLAVLSFGH